MKKNCLIAWALILLSVFHFVPVIAAADSRASNLAPSALSTSSGQTVRFAVFSDPHFYDSALGTSGEAFEAYLNGDRKMLRESEAILKAAISGMKQDNIQFVLLSGDMTKDGELSSHTKIAAYLKDLEDSGIQVYVVPGNHDINNPDAVSYSGDTTTPVPNISPDDFVQIYGQFGGGRTLYPGHGLLPIPGKRGYPQRRRPFQPGNPGLDSQPDRLGQGR
ncbi:MAG: metallophosphoesterase [Deltaproteobacteria bacterium]|nr:metallophosphoesterase [Deltaproteobacteria bacterium]